MESVIIKDNLREGLSVVERISGEGLSLPVLKYTLIETSENKLKLTTTNLEIAVTFSTPCKVIEKGKVAVPVSVFSSLVGNLQSDRIILSSRGGQLELKTDNYEAFIQSTETDDFPIIPKIKEKGAFIQFEPGILKEALSRVIVATQVSDVRPELNSVLVDFSLDSLKFASTDSFRLAEATVAGGQFKAANPKEFKILLPLKTCQEVVRIFKDEETIKMYKDQNQILFETERIEFISRLIDGNFPEYSQVIPKKFTSEVTVDREKFINAIKLAGIFGGHSSEIKIRVLEGSKTFEVASSSQEIGKNKYLLPVKATSSVGEVGFNGRYFLDALKVLKTKDVFIGISEEDRRPTLIKSPNEASYFYILMPTLKD